MISRRDILIGASCVGAAGLAYGLKPRREVSLLGERKVSDIVPRAFGEWTSQEVGGLVAPKVEGSLSDRLYNELVERIYMDARTGTEIMMLLAHGARNTDELQLHRPESCYPAFGFALISNRATDLSLAPGVSLPARRLVADAPGRRESIVYWSRLGEYLPIDGRQQQLDRLKTSFAGYIPDGLLARFSAIGTEPEEVFPIVSRFIVELLQHTPANGRDALIGTALARSLSKPNL